MQPLGYGYITQGRRSTNTEMYSSVLSREPPEALEAESRKFREAKYDAAGLTKQKSLRNLNRSKDEQKEPYKKRKY